MMLLRCRATYEASIDLDRSTFQLTLERRFHRLGLRYYLETR